MLKINRKGELVSGILLRVLASINYFEGGKKYLVRVTGVLIIPKSHDLKCRPPDPNQGDPTEFSIWAIGDDEAQEYVERRYIHAEGGNEYDYKQIELVLYRLIINHSCAIQHD